MMHKKTAVPILIKKISQDLEDLKGSLNIVRENPQYMANEFLSMAMQCLTEYNIQKVSDSKHLPSKIMNTRHLPTLEGQNMNLQGEHICLLHLMVFLHVCR